jgi:hypothetical protein
MKGASQSPNVNQSKKIGLDDKSVLLSSIYDLLVGLFEITVHYKEQ